MSLFWEWDPFHELDTLQRRLDRLYNQSTTPALESKRGGAEPRELARTSFTWRPQVDVRETDKEIILHADVPGVSENDLSVSIDNGMLTVSGKREATKKEENERFHRIERSFGSFSRSVPLPEHVDPAAVKASFENGVLEVHVPKPEKEQPKKVSISVTGKKGDEMRT